MRGRDEAGGVLKQAFFWGGRGGETRWPWIRGVDEFFNGLVWRCQLVPSGRRQGRKEGGGSV